MVTIDVLLQLLDCTSSLCSDNIEHSWDPPGMQRIRAGCPSQGTAGAAAMTLQGLLQSELLRGQHMP